MLGKFTNGVCLAMDTPSPLTLAPAHPNAGDYQLIQAGIDDEMLATMWISKPRRARSPHTQAQYRRVWASLRQALPKPLQTIKVDDLLAWANGLQGTPNTVKLHVSAVKSLFSFAYKVGYLRVNPAMILETPHVPNQKHAKVLREEEVFALLAAAKTKQDKALVRTLYSAGLRVSELCHLRWQDVVPTVGGKAMLIVYGKGGHQREAEISAASHAALQELRAAVAPADYIFRTRTGHHLDRSEVHRLLKRLAQAAGIGKPVSAHWLRHSHASHALDNGANPKAVQEQLGHSSLAVTTGYLHTDKGTASFLKV
jgi:site-specific recombinase XerD